MEDIWEEAKNTNMTGGEEPSPFLKELIEKNINEELSIDEVIKELVNHYENN